MPPGVVVPTAMIPQAPIGTYAVDRFLRASDDADLDRLGRAASTREPLSLAEVPTFLKAPFLKRDGTVGDIVIVYPSVGLSDGRQSMAFADDVSQVELPDGTTYHAASTSIVASDMLRLMIEEAPLMIVLTISLILVFKIIALGSLRWVAFALAPSRQASCGCSAGWVHWA